MGKTSCLLLLLCLAACPPPPKKAGDGTTVTVTGGDDDPVGTFDPGAPLGDPPAPDPQAYGLPYLEQVYDHLRDGWSAFLEDARTRLPPSHALNSQTLEAKLQLTIDGNGALTDLTVLSSSGNADFDATAQEVVQESAPFPAPPHDLLSDDDHIYLTWLFARDRRQAGVATASVHREEWPLERAIPKFIGDGNVTEAARRLDQAGAAAPAELVAVVMVGALREGLESSDLAVQRVAVDDVLALAAKLPSDATPPMVHDLRSIASGSVEIAVRAQAVRALGALHDTDSREAIAEILAKDQGHNAALSAGAAAALVALGDKDVATTLKGWLASGDRGKVGGALATLSAATVPGLAGEIAGHVTDKDLGVRVAACRALGVATDAPAWKALRKGLDDRDASVRAACAASIATIGAAGKSRASFYRLVELFKDRDDHVRAEAVLAAATLEPTKVVEELGAFRKETSAVVLAGLASALGRVAGADVPKRLTELAGHAEPSVRVAAVTALIARGPKGAAIAAKMIVDPDRTVRLAALPAISDAETLAGLATDPDADVAAAAQAARIGKLGRAAAQAEVLATLENSPAASLARVAAAAAWLRAG